MEDEKSGEKPEKIKQEQVHDILFNREIEWQEIIYDLINTEQLDPWDVNIINLTDRYFEKIHEYEEADFFVSSKVLLAASLLLRIKSEFLLNKHIKSIDEILFGKKEEKLQKLERIELNEEIPELVPKSPIPRARKVTLNELIESLNKAINTENRRIQKEIIKKNAIRETGIAIPKKKFSLKDKIKEIYNNLTNYLEKNNEKKVSFSLFVHKNKESKIGLFSPLLHLEHQKKIWLEQGAPFEEIYIWVKKVFLEHNPDPFAELYEDLEEKSKKMNKEQKKRAEKIEKEFEKPVE